MRVERARASCVPWMPVRGEGRDDACRERETGLDGVEVGWDGRGVDLVSNHMVDFFGVDDAKAYLYAVVIFYNCNCGC